MANEPQIDIRTLTIDEIKDFFIKKNEKPFRAKQVYEWIWKKAVYSFDEMTNLPKALRENLKKHFLFRKLNMADFQKSRDGTVKIAFALHDKAITEGVLIPSENRSTACISTQVGCPLNCSFCATGQLGFTRNLTTGEIFDQVIEINRLSEKRLNRPLSNIVIMGMGEPLLNFENTMQAIEIITSDKGLGISPQRITISTAGLVTGIKKMADSHVRFNLAISLHTADNKKRDKLMPLNKSNNLEQLAGAIIYFHEKTQQRITFEYLLLKDVNDDIQDAKKLARFCRIVPCKVNLIEYNATGNQGFQKSPAHKTQQFADFLKSKNMIVNVRKSKGNDIHAACGQLANTMKKN